MDQDPRAQQKELNGVELVSKFSGSRLELLELLSIVADQESCTNDTWYEIINGHYSKMASDIVFDLLMSHGDEESRARRRKEEPIELALFMRQELAELVERERVVDEREAGLQTRIGVQAARASLIDSSVESTESTETKATVESTRDLNRRIKAALGGSPRGGRRQNQGGSWKPRIG